MEASTLHAPSRLVAPAWRRLGSDETLVAAVRAGDDRAFEAIFDRYHRPLLSFCRHMLGNREEGEDALQQTFLGAYRDLVSSTKPIHLRPWLYAIARNQCLSILRARRDKVSLDDAQPATEGLASEVAQREDIRNMLVDLRRLPDDQRAGLVLAELGSLSHEEIAEIVGCPRAKVKALVFQARRSLAASRLARETPCSEVREQLATLAGGALRRGALRRHVRECAGCRAFESEVRRQRRTMAALLPIVPSAGLKSAILAEIGIGGGGAAAIGAGTLGGLGAVGAGSAGKLIALGLIAVGAGTVGAVAVEDELRQETAPAPAPARSASERSPWGSGFAARRPAAPDGREAGVAPATDGFQRSAGASKAWNPRAVHQAVGRGSPGHGARTSTRGGRRSGRGNDGPRGPESSPGRSRHTPASDTVSPGKPEDAPGHSVEAPDNPAAASDGPVDTPGRSGGPVDRPGRSGGPTAERRVDPRPEVPHGR